MSKVVKWIVGVVIVVLVAGILVWAFLQGRDEAATEAAQERPVKVPGRASTENGETVVTLDAGTQARNGIEVTTLRPASHRQELRANALVLPVQDLTTLRNNYLTSEAQVEKAKAALDVSSREYQRLKELYQDNQNASAKALQAAEGAWRADEVTLKAARDSLTLSESLVRQTWGSTVADWLITGAPSSDRVLAQKDALFQVSLPPGAGGDPPKEASVEMPDGKTQFARLVSELPRVDPRILSPTYLYITPSGPRIAPGMSLLCRLPEGSATRGVVVPSRAVVWWQGRAWAYVRTTAERFVRREVPSNAPVDGGWFVNAGFTPGERVVTSGAQQLHSEEFRSQIQVIGEGEEGEKD